MRFTTSLAVLAAAVSTVSAFDASGSNNVAVYWGQGSGQQRLSAVCENPDVDIAILAFVDYFPDQSPGNYPGTNFGNQCGDTYYKVGNVTTKLLDNCPLIGPDIQTCQSLGKKVLLSVGGGWPIDYWIKNQTTAYYFADFLWGAFGPVTADWTAENGPRPFGDAVVDGFDFDIESNLYGLYPLGDDGYPVEDYMSRGYADMISRLQEHYKASPSKQYYISGAPQCSTPDVHLAEAIANSWFDFIFVQFYNTDGCSARDAVNYGQGVGTDDISFGAWTQVPSLNPNAKIYIGLPATGTAASAGARFYLNVTEVYSVVKRFIGSPRLGGIMVWEATYSQSNVLCDKEYTSWMKKILDTCSAGSTFSDSCPSSTSSSSIASSTHSSSSSSVTTSSWSSSSSSSSSKTSTSSSSTQSSSSRTSSWSSSSSSSSSKTSTSSSSTQSSSSRTSSPSSSKMSSSAETSSSYSWPRSTSSSTSSPSSSSRSYSGRPTSTSSSRSWPTSSSSSSPSSTSSSSSSEAWPPSSSESSSSSSSQSSSASLPSSSTSCTESSTSSSVTSSTPASPAASSPTSSTTCTESFSSSDSSSSSAPATPVTSSPTPSTSCTESSSSSSSPQSSSSSSSPVTPSSTLPASSTESSSSSSTTCTESSSSQSSSSSSPMSPIAPSSSKSWPSSSKPRPPPSSQSSSSSTPGKPTTSPTTTATPSSSQPYGGTITTTVITTSYVDVCPTGLTTVVITYTTTICPESTTPAVLSGWTTTVTVCGHCGPAPTTLTLTKPVGPSSPPAPTGSPSALPASVTKIVSTFSVVPVPASQNWSPMSAACGGAGCASSAVAPVAGQGTGLPAKPIAAAEGHNNGTSSSYKSGPTVPGYSKSSAAPVAQFTGAAPKTGSGFCVSFAAVVFAALLAL